MTWRSWAAARLLQASATAPLADWFARLSDVAPDGTVTQITGAGLNGAQRDSMTDLATSNQEDCIPSTSTMHLTSWVFPKGHRIRLAISNALWPMILPTALLHDHIARAWGPQGSSLRLPVVPVKGVTPSLCPPQPSEERSDIRAMAFPGRANGRSNVMKPSTRQRCVGGQS